MATSTSGCSPGVRMSWSGKWIWKPDTPGSEPAGARISAGKSGSVERSFPSSAVSLVKRPPVSCIPSPESPANRMTTRSSCSTGLAINPERTGIAPRPESLADQLGETRIVAQRIEVRVRSGSVASALLGLHRGFQTLDRGIYSAQQGLSAGDVEENSGVSRQVLGKKLLVELDRR